MAREREHSQSPWPLPSSLSWALYSKWGEKAKARLCSSALAYLGGASFRSVESVGWLRLGKQSSSHHNARITQGKGFAFVKELVQCIGALHDDPSVDPKEDVLDNRNMPDGE